MQTFLFGLTVSPKVQVNRSLKDRALEHPKPQVHLLAFQTTTLRSSAKALKPKPLNPKPHQT